MPTYTLLYNRFSQQVCPDFDPATIEGETPKKALQKAFGYSFHRVYREAAKSPDIVLFEGLLAEDGSMIKTPKNKRMSFVAVNKLYNKENAVLTAERISNGKRRLWDDKRKRWLFSRKKM